MALGNNGRSVRCVEARSAGVRAVAEEWGRAHVHPKFGSLALDSYPPEVDKGSTPIPATKVSIETFFLCPDLRAKLPVQNRIASDTMSAEIDTGPEGSDFQ